MTKTLLSILTAAVVTYLVRVLPLTLIRKPIRSRFLRSFLYYVPYVTLAVMPSCRQRSSPSPALRRSWPGSLSPGAAAD